MTLIPLISAIVATPEAMTAPVGPAAPRKRSGYDPGARHRPRRHQLGGRIRRRQHMRARRADRLDMRGKGQRALAASSTSAAWPFTFTLRQIRCTFPWAPNRKVARSIPI